MSSGHIDNYYKSCKQRYAKVANGYLCRFFCLLSWVEIPTCLMLGFGQCCVAFLMFYGRLPSEKEQPHSCQTLDSSTLPSWWHSWQSIQNCLSRPPLSSIYHCLSVRPSSCFLTGQAILIPKQIFIVLIWGRHLLNVLTKTISQIKALVIEGKIDFLNQRSVGWTNLILHMPEWADGLRDKEREWQQKKSDNDWKCFWEASCQLYLFLAMNTSKAGEFYNEMKLTMWKALGSIHRLYPPLWNRESEKHGGIFWEYILLFIEFGVLLVNYCLECICWKFNKQRFEKKRY